jgi:hypothetical protein
MSCARLSLLMNVTREPGDTAIEFGEAPFDVIVMVVVATGVPPPRGEGEGEGYVGLPRVEPPPQAATAKITTTAPTGWPRLFIRRISSKC